MSRALEERRQLMPAVQKEAMAKLLDYLKALHQKARLQDMNGAAKLAGARTPTREQFAAACGTTYPLLKQICYAARPCSVSLAVAIDRETGGEIRMEDLCPDRIDWAYVRTAMRKRRS